MKKLLISALLVVAAFAADPLYKQVYQFQNRIQVADPVYTFGATAPTLTNFPVTYSWSGYFINQNPPGDTGAVANGNQVVDLMQTPTKTVTASGVTVTYAQLIALIQQAGQDNWTDPAAKNKTTTATFKP